MSGLAGSGLVLQDNGSNNLAVSANGPFAFPTALASGAAYSVTVFSQPTSPNQTCVVTAPSGTLSSSNVTNVSVACTTATYTVGGTVSGLLGTGLVLQDNGGSNLAVSANGPFTFPTALASGAAYSVTVFSQPTSPNQTCVVTAPSGTLSSSNVTNVSVACTTATYTVGGTVSGLLGTGLVLQDNGGSNLAVSANGPFTFPAALASGTNYGVTVLAQPAHPDQNCVVTSGNGTVTNVAITGVAVACNSLVGPSIQSIPPVAGVVGKSIQYQIVAQSDAPATLAYTLTTAPAGMSIGTTTGLMQWTPASNQAGDQSVTIMVQDSVGQTSQSFTLSIFGIGSGTSALISAANGGVITVSDPSSPINGLSISIPPGALATDTTITVSALSSPPTLGGTPHFFIQGFSIDPDGTSLSIPATLMIPYDTSQFSANQGIASESFLGAYFVQTPTGYLEFLDNFSADTIHHTMTGTVPHFSGYMITNTAQLCPPPTSGQPCPSQFPPSDPSWTPSILLPALLVHGFEPPVPKCGKLGDDSTWGQLRPLLSQQLDSGQGGRIDAWAFNWDSACVPFEASASYLSTAIQKMTTLAPTQQSPPVNVVAHSFGGILVWTYLGGLGAGGYRSNVNSLMSLATPYQGIGDNVTPPLTYVTSWASYCATIAQLDPASWPTCYAVGTGNPGFGKGIGLPEGYLVTHLKSLQNLPAIRYDAVIGEKFSSCVGGGSCSQLHDDGLITTTSAQCNFPNCVQETNPNILPTANTGFCHSAGLCAPNNFAIAQVDNIGHPLWDKICSFLGCLPAINVTVSPPAAGTVTSAPDGSPGINCAQDPATGMMVGCTGLFPASTDVKLTATPADTFVGWGGACASAGANAQCMLTTLPVDQNLGGDQVTATFGYTVGGTVSGLTGSGFVLQDNGGNNLAVSANGSFTFTTALASGTAYNVTVLTQPTNPSQTCVVTSGSGTVSGSNVTNVSVVCTTNTYTVGGTVSGLMGSGLVLQDNGSDNLAVSGNGPFAFSTALASGAGYSVTVLNQPINPSQACTVSLGSGTITSSNVTDISIACTTTTPSLVVTGSGSTSTQFSGDYYGSYSSTPFTLSSAQPSVKPSDNFNITGSFASTSVTIHIQGNVVFGQTVFNFCPYSFCTWVYGAGATLNVSLQGAPGTNYAIDITRTASLSAVTADPDGAYSASADSASVDTLLGPPSASFSTVSTVQGTGSISTTISLNAGLGFRQTSCVSDSQGCLGGTTYPGGGDGTVDYTLTIVARVQ